MSGSSRPFELLPGVRLDRYELLCVLARGRATMVWAARITGKKGFEKLVALKTLQPEHAADERAVRALMDEARIASAIEDPHVVRALDSGEQGDVPYLVMDLVEGETVQALSKGLARAKRKMPLGVALRIAADLCAGLTVAHEKKGADRKPLGIVHRDVSPENVLVATGGHARLVDFGVARDHERATGMTTSTNLAAKPHFIAPELALGAPADARADLWSAGAVLYFMLAGRPPYEEGHTLATLHALTSRAAIPPLPADVPAAVRALVDQALQHDPELRFARAAGMQAAIESAGAESGLASRPELSKLVLEVLEPELTARRKHIEHALAEADHRARVSAVLMMPPPPPRTPSTPPADAPPKRVDTLRPPSTQRMPEVVRTTSDERPPDTVREATLASTNLGLKVPTIRPVAHAASPFPPEPGTQPYGLRPPPTPTRSSHPPKKPSSVPPPLPRAAQPSSLSLPPLPPPPLPAVMVATDPPLPMQSSGAARVVIPIAIGALVIVGVVVAAVKLRAHPAPPAPPPALASSAAPQRDAIPLPTEPTLTSAKEDAPIASSTAHAQVRPAPMPTFAVSALPGVTAPSVKVPADPAPIASPAPAPAPTPKKHDDDPGF